MLQYVLDKMGKDVVLMSLGGGSAVLTEADNGKLYFIQADAQTVTLPDSPPVGWKVAVGIGNLSITGAVVTQGTNRFVVPGTNPIAIAPTNWQSSKYGSYCWFMYAGSDFWVMLDGNGEWANDAGKTIAAYNWDGNVAGATQDNLASFDAYGNPIDSGRAEADVTLKDGSRAFTNPVGGATPTDSAHLTTKDYVDGVIQGMDWQDSVQHNLSYLKVGSSGAPTGGSGETSGEKCLNTNDGKLYTYTASWDAGVAVSTGDRFIFKQPGGTGSGFTDGTTATEDNKIREYNGSSFDETVPNKGFAVMVEDQDKQYNFNGTAWVPFGSTVTHNNTSGLNDGDYKHLTASEYTGTGTGDFVRETSPTIVTPTIASMTNAQHDHADAAGGGTVAHSATTGQGTDDHHAKSHAHDGADGSGTVAHSDTTGQGTDDHHARDHASSHVGAGADVLKFSWTDIISIKEGLSRPGTTAPAALAQLGTGDGQIECRDFSGGAGNADTIIIPWDVPDDIDVSENVSVSVLGYVTVATGPTSGQGVVFDISGFSIGDEDTLNGTPGTAVSSSKSWAGGGSQYERWVGGGVNITITNLAAKEQVMFKVVRDADDGSDTYEQEVGVYALKVTYKKKMAS
jgi:hypothetical protein